MADGIGVQEALATILQHEQGRIAALADQIAEEWNRKRAVWLATKKDSDRPKLLLRVEHRKVGVTIGWTRPTFTKPGGRWKSWGAYIPHGKKLNYVAADLKKWGKAYEVDEALKLEPLLSQLRRVSAGLTGIGRAHAFYHRDAGPLLAALEAHMSSHGAEGSFVPPARSGSAVAGRPKDDTDEEAED